MKNKGFRGESQRHALSSHGIKTKSAEQIYTQLNQIENEKQKAIKNQQLIFHKKIQDFYIKEKKDIRNKIYDELPFVKSVKGIRLGPTKIGVSVNLKNVIPCLDYKNEVDGVTEIYAVDAKTTNELIQKLKQQYSKLLSKKVNVNLKTSTINPYIWNHIITNREKELILSKIGFEYERGWSWWTMISTKAKEKLKQIKYSDIQKSHI